MELAERLSRLLVGQPEAISTIVPFVQMHAAGLNPEGRPAGVVLLAGPTGSGKTRTVESLAKCLHGNARSMLKIDCGEFQMEHEVAKLIGAPPGYLGHRETTPLLTQAKINAASSEASALSLILFDEVEKAAPSFARLLLGVLDKATLRLGDNSTANFENCLIFMTSNLGAQQMQDSMAGFGFDHMLSKARAEEQHRIIESAVLAAVSRKFSPEFVNRIDRIVSYRALVRDDYSLILDDLLDEFQLLINKRLGIKKFVIGLTAPARSLLLDKGTSTKYGARELRRTLQRHMMYPIGEMVADGKVKPGQAAVLAVSDGDLKVQLREAA